MTREPKYIQRLFVDQPLSADKVVTLTDNAAHYLRNVLRANIDDAVLVFNGRDGEWHAHVKAIDKRMVTLVTAQRARAQTTQADIDALLERLPHHVQRLREKRKQT